MSFRPTNYAKPLLPDRPNQHRHPEVLLAVLGPDELGVIWLEGGFMLENIRYKGRE